MIAYILVWSLLHLQSSVARVGSDSQIVPQRSQTLLSVPKQQPQIRSTSKDEVVVPRYVIPVGSAQHSPTTVEPDIEVITSPQLIGAKAKSDRESLLSKAALDYTRGQRSVSFNNRYFDGPFERLASS